MSKKAPTINQLAWCSSFIGSHFDPYDEPPTFDELRKRIVGKVTYLFLPRCFAWNQKIQPLQRWDSLLEPFDVDNPPDKSWNKKGKDKCLAILRHSMYEYTLERADYVQNVTDIDCILTGTIYFKNGQKRSGLFWLIKASEARFVYAILKSSMFRAWCKLTANKTTWTNKNGKQITRNGDFAEGMWNTFPLPSLTKDQRDRIIEAEKNQEQLDEIVDALFNLRNATDEERESMLASGFYETFQGI